MPYEPRICVDGVWTPLTLSVLDRSLPEHRESPVFRFAEKIDADLTLDRLYPDLPADQRKVVSV
jgi:hypothetical protein